MFEGAVLRMTAFELPAITPPSSQQSYKSNQGLWSHKKICKATTDLMVVSVSSETYLHAKIDNLEKVIGFALSVPPPSL